MLLSQKQTNKKRFLNHDQRMFTVFMNLEILLYFTFMAQSIQNLKYTVLASLKFVCWVTQQFSRTYFFICIYGIWDTSFVKFAYVIITRGLISGPSTKSYKFRTIYILTCPMGTYSWILQSNFFIYTFKDYLKIIV